MSDWKRIDKGVYRYTYGGFYISYSTEIKNRRAVDFMKAKKIHNIQGEEEKIILEATGDSFTEVKGKICKKIDAFNE